jgi:hypothetical protein
MVAVYPLTAQKISYLMVQSASAHLDMHSTSVYAQNAQITHNRVEIKVNAFVLIQMKFLSKIPSPVADVPVIPHQVLINRVAFAIRDILLLMEVASDSLILIYFIYCSLHFFL